VPNLPPSFLQENATNATETNKKRILSTVLERLKAFLVDLRFLHLASEEFPSIFVGTNKTIYAAFRVSI
jgi:hypothetical protein